MVVTVPIQNVFVIYRVCISDCSMVEEFFEDIGKDKTAIVK